MRSPPARLGDLLPGVVAALAARHSTNGAPPMPKFRMKHAALGAVTVDAVQFTGNFDEIEDFVGGDAEFRAGKLVVATREGALTASPRDWIIRDPKGVFHAVKPDIFEATYEPADGAA